MGVQVGGGLEPFAHTPATRSATCTRARALSYAARSSAAGRTDPIPQRGCSQMVALAPMIKTGRLLVIIGRFAIDHGIHGGL